MWIKIACRLFGHRWKNFNWRTGMRGPFYCDRCFDAVWQGITWPPPPRRKEE